MENSHCEKCDLTKSDSVYSCANKFCQCHSKAPENMFDHTTPVKPTINANTVEAPTDEGWNWDLNSLWYKEFKNDYPNLLKQFREFIASLLQKEKEKGYSKGMFDATGGENAFDWRTRFVEQGKSEAFSLVRHRLAVMRPTSELDYTVEYRVAVANFFTLLDTLEGK